jgi:hypothetical protein
MTWELYEVWTEDEYGHQELVDTTKSYREAEELAQLSLTEGAFTVVIFKETEDGDTEEIERLTLG